MRHDTDSVSARKGRRVGRFGAALAERASRLGRWVDRMIPERVVGQGPDAVVRARVVLLTPVAFLFVAVPASIEYAHGGAPVAAMTIVAGVLLAPLTAILLRHGTAPVAHAQLAIFVGVVAVLAWISGGMGAPPLYAYLLLPIIGVALMGAGPAALWTLVAGLVVAGFLVVEILGRSPPLMVSPDSLRRGHGVLELVGLAVTLVFTLLYDTQRGLAVEQLEKAREQAEVANEVKTAFLANASHELRTPMNGVLGMSSLLQLSELDPRHREMVDVIHESATNLLALMDDILDYAQLAAGGLRLSEASFAVAEFIDGIASMMTSFAERKGLRLVCEIDPAVPSCLVGDSLRIRQILVNLLSNAIKFTDSGQVTLRVCSESEPGGASLVVRVADTGPGIPASDHERIFDRFERLDSSSSRMHPGKGLGLAICRRLLDLIGGEIAVESEVGSGSCFTIRLWLPTGDEPERINAASIHATPLETRLRVLVAEDNEVNQRVVRSMLELLGCEVDIATDGHEALAMLGAESFDAVLMDCHMPGMDGFAATRAIRESPGFGGISVIGLTASITADDRAKCLASGMEQVLAKPCRIQDLRAALVERCKNARTRMETRDDA